MTGRRTVASQRRGSEAVLFAFDLIEHVGDDLGNLRLIDHKRRLAELIGKAKRAVTRDRQLHFLKTGVCAICLRSQRERARKIRHSRMRPPLLMKA